MRAEVAEVGPDVAYLEELVEAFDAPLRVPPPPIEFQGPQVILRLAWPEE